MIIDRIPDAIQCADGDKQAECVADGNSHLFIADRGTPVSDRTGRVRCRRRLGGLLNFYEWAA